MRRTTLRTTLRTTTLLATILATLFAVAGAASGHASTQQRQVPADRDQTLLMRVPGERVGEHNVGIDIRVPGAFAVLACTPPVDWTCAAVDDRDGTTISWRRTGDTPGPADIHFAFDVHTPVAQGTYFLPTLQRYSGGEEVAWIGREDGADHPSPRIQVGDEDAPVEDNDAPASDHEQPTTGPTPESSEAARGEARPERLATEPATADDRGSASEDADGDVPSTTTARRADGVDILQLAPGASLREPRGTVVGSAAAPDGAVVAGVAPAEGEPRSRTGLLVLATAVLATTAAAAVGTRRRLATARVRP